MFANSDAFEPLPCLLKSDLSVSAERLGNWADLQFGDAVAGSG